MRTLPYRLTLVAAMSLVSFSGASVYAMEAMPKATEQPEASVKTADPDSQGAAHSAAGQLKACKNREEAINGIMARVVDRGTKQIKVFDTIATRTETFYKSKGMTVANYAALVASVNTTKTQAKADLAAMKTTGTINCAAADPKATVKAFKANLQKENADLKAFKTAVKNLIVAVKSAQGMESSSPKPSPSPKASPETTNEGGR